jgi:hypothetical protein
MKFAGFVSLPIGGDPAENLRTVLAQIQSGLVELHAETVQQVGNRITFSAGFLSFKRWVGRNPLLWITSGEIQLEPSGDFLMLDYRLSFSQLLIASTACVLWFVVTSGKRIHATGQPLTNVLLLSAIMWLLLCVGNAAVAMFRFSKFLRQFPLKD